ncbi:hypothetical protein [Actinoplanes sp. NPDC026619]|uniref:hypothetical protein n=1 Tax=Actinoplanes sp. NPDC026619 TaxID=3155798 RepID=UPI0033F8DE0A
MDGAGYEIIEAQDEFAGDLCLGSTETADHWSSYQGPSSELILDGKEALDRARHAGVFTVGWWVARPR